MKLARRYLISGRVQGVGYRYFAERCARELGICGYVLNRPDGSVEVYAIGDQHRLEAFKKRLAQGPPSARVKRVDEIEEAVDERYTDFTIESSW
jgi:acylphosphatase